MEDLLNKLFTAVDELQVNLKHQTTDISTVAEAILRIVHESAVEMAEDILFGGRTYQNDHESTSPALVYRYKKIFFEKAIKRIKEGTKNGLLMKALTARFKAYHAPNIKRFVYEGEVYYCHKGEKLVGVKVFEVQGKSAYEAKPVHMHIKVVLPTYASEWGDIESLASVVFWQDYGKDFEVTGECDLLPIKSFNMEVKL